MDMPSMFEQARSLIAGSKIIIDSDGINDGGITKRPTTPVIMCCAFAIEICLKLLHVAETSISPKGHNLEILYDSLPIEHKQRVVKHYIKLNGDVTHDELKGLIEAHKSIFVEWRYAFEKDDFKECSPTFLFCFAYALNTYIEQNYNFTRNDNGWLVETNI